MPSSSGTTRVVASLNGSAIGDDMIAGLATPVLWITGVHSLPPVMVPPAKLAISEPPAPGEGIALGQRYCEPTLAIVGQIVRFVPRSVSPEPWPPEPGGVTFGPRTSIIPLAIHQITRAPGRFYAMAEPPPPDPGAATIRGRSWSGAWTTSIIAGYHVYANNGSGGAINYGGPIATIPLGTTTYNCGALAPGTWAFGVRAFTAGGEEQNLDCAVTIVVSASHTDATNVPVPAIGLRALPIAGGSVKVEWYYPITRGAKTPTGFYVYITAGSSPSYTTPAATVLWGTRFQGMFVATLSGLTGGTAYVVGVRAYNASGTETNTYAVSVTSNASGPPAVASLTASVGV